MYGETSYMSRTVNMNVWESFPYIPWMWIYEKAFYTSHKHKCMGIHHIRPINMNIWRYILYVPYLWIHGDISYMSHKYKYIRIHFIRAINMNAWLHKSILWTWIHNRDLQSAGNAVSLKVEAHGNEHKCMRCLKELGIGALSDAGGCSWSLMLLYSVCETGTEVCWSCHSKGPKPTRSALLL